jgi:hypothetical protein
VDGLAISLNELASILVANARLEDATKNWDPSQLDRVRLNQNRIFTHYYAGKLQDGIALAQSSNKEKAVGDKHVDVAMAQATLGAGLVYAHRDAEALLHHRRRRLKAKCARRGDLPNLRSNTLQRR